MLLILRATVLCLSGSPAADTVPFVFFELRVMTLAYCLSHVGMGQRSCSVASWRRVGLWVGAEWQVGCSVKEDSAGGDAGRTRDGGRWGGFAHTGAPPPDGWLKKRRNCAPRRCCLFRCCVCRHHKRRNRVRRRRQRTACSEARRRRPVWLRSSRRRRCLRLHFRHRPGCRPGRRRRFVRRCGHRSTRGAWRRKGPCGSPCFGDRPLEGSPWCWRLGRSRRYRVRHLRLSGARKRAHRLAPDGAAAGSSVVGAGGATIKCYPVLTATAMSRPVAGPIRTVYPINGGGSAHTERRAPGGRRRHRRQRDGAPFPRQKRPEAGRVAERRPGGTPQPEAAPMRGTYRAWGSPVRRRRLGGPGGGSWPGGGATGGRCRGGSVGAIR